MGRRVGAAERVALYRFSACVAISAWFIQQPIEGVSCGGQLCNLGSGKIILRLTGANSVPHTLFKQQARCLRYSSPLVLGNSFQSAIQGGSNPEIYLFL